jgi:Xaa-Pro aminopeptidase
MKLRSARIGLVAGDETVDELSISLFKEIQEGLPQAKLEMASDLISRLRMEKSPGEIEKLRQAAHISELAASAMQPAVVAGNEDYLAAAQAGLKSKAEGAERCDLFISVDPSRIALPPLHLCFGPGNPVSFELTVEYEGYWVQLCRTFFLGRPSSKQKQIFKACCDAYEAALECCRPGLPVAGIAKAAVDTLERKGLASGLKYGLGHGVGLDIPEPYSVDLHSKATLGSNMILVIHVGVWVPGEGSALVGGPIVVGQSGAIPLDHPQREMIQL